MKGIQKLVLNGNLGEAIDLTYQLFPGILERNSNLLFALKVRQFIEMISSSNSTELSAANGAAVVATSSINEMKQISTKISSINSELNTAGNTMLVDTDKFHSNGNNNGFSNLKYTSTLNEEAMGNFI